MRHFQQNFVFFCLMDESDFMIKIFGIKLPSDLKSFF